MSAQEVAELRAQLAVLERRVADLEGAHSLLLGFSIAVIRQHASREVLEAQFASAAFVYGGAADAAHRAPRQMPLTAATFLTLRHALQGHAMPPRA